MKHSLCAALLLMLLMGSSPMESSAAPAPSCRVWVGGMELSTVYETAVCHQRYWEENPPLSTTPVAIAVQEGPGISGIKY